MQNDFELENARGIDYRLDANNALQSLATLSSGDTQPPAVYANMWWADTGNMVLWRRDHKNTKWLHCGFLNPDDADTVALINITATGNVSAKGVLTTPSIRASTTSASISTDKIWHTGNFDPKNMAVEYNASGTGHGWENWMGSASGQRLYFTADGAAYNVFRATAPGVIDAAALQVVSSSGGAASTVGLNVRDNSGRSVTFYFSSANGGAISTPGGTIRPNTVNYVNGIAPDGNGNVNISTSAVTLVWDGYLENGSGNKVRLYNSWGDGLFWMSDVLFGGASILDAHMVWLAAGQFIYGNGQTGWVTFSLRKIA